MQKKTQKKLQKSAAIPHFLHDSCLESPGWGQGSVRNANVPIKPQCPRGVHTELEQLSEASKQKKLL